MQNPQNALKRASWGSLKNGAGGEARTRDIFLGKNTYTIFDRFDGFVQLPKILACSTRIGFDLLCSF